ncbi:hypothetical protein [Nocardia sp. NPDC056000]|uniref:hypothetical protein n=1 Tax=Nocardia sp. NPDC056000 TaxID=3345674 RepID=UPI0035E33A50
MIRIVRAEAGSDRLLKWVGYEGVTILDFARDREYELVSVGRFPVGSGGTIDWTETPGELVIATGDDGQIESFVDRFMPESDSYVLLWSNFAIPGVVVSAAKLADYLPDILDRNPEFWIYGPGSGVLLENTFAGVVTVSRIPGGEDPVRCR